LDGIDSKGKVIGVTGLYSLKYDEKEAYWLGWYCVNPSFRGEGIGRDLLGFIINLSKMDNKKWLRLYTSKDPNEKRANEIYNKLGFKPLKEKIVNELVTGKFKFTKGLIFKELEL